jgi:hypothetical protein
MGERLPSGTRAPSSDPADQVTSGGRRGHLEAGRHLRDHRAPGAARGNAPAAPRQPRAASGGSSAANVAASRIDAGSTPTPCTPWPPRNGRPGGRPHLTTCRELHGAVKRAVATALPLTTDDEPVDLLELLAAQPSDASVEPARSAVAMTDVQRHALTQAAQPGPIVPGSATAVPSAAPPRWTRRPPSDPTRSDPTATGRRWWCSRPRGTQALRSPSSSIRARTIWWSGSEARTAAARHGRMRCALTSTPAAHGPLCLRGMARLGTCPRKALR